MHQPSAAENAALIALLNTRPDGANWQTLTTEVLNSDSAEAVWQSYGESALVPDPARAGAIELAYGQLESWKRQGLTFLSVLDPMYPSQLRDIHQAPPFLFAAGTLVQDDDAVSVVGSRRATAQGLKIADSLARALVHEGLTVLAGLAEGIDTAAHTAALDEGGRTVAIIGTGITRYFPTFNKGLQDTIADNGLVLSQFWPDSSPTRYNFPIRNAVMSGYGIASVIVEATENSGTRAQARMAVEHGRPVILTDRVAAATNWGRKLADRPGVEVASSTADVLRLLQKIRRRRDLLPTLLAEMASAAS